MKTRTPEQLSRLPNARLIRRTARKNYGTTAITEADRSAFANVEKPDVSPTLDR